MNYSQNVLIDKINEFLEFQFQNKEEMDSEEKKLLLSYKKSKGMCAGLSALESFERKTISDKESHKSHFWTNYTKLIEWNNQTNFSEEETEELLSFIRNVRDYQFKQCNPDNSRSDDKLKYLLDLEGNKFIQIESLEDYIVDTEFLSEILKSKLEPDNILYIGARSDDGSHITNVCIDAQGEISFYDSNSSGGSESINDINELSDELFSALDPSKFRGAMSGMHMSDICLRRISIKVYKHEKDVSSDFSETIINKKNNNSLFLVEKYAKFLQDDDHHIYKKLQEDIGSVSVNKLLNLHTQNSELQNFLNPSINKIKNDFVSQLKEIAYSKIPFTEQDQDKIASLTATGLKLGNLLNYNEASLLLEINLGKTELVDQVYSKVTDYKGKPCFALIPIIKNIQSGNIETVKQIILSAFKYFQSLPSEEGIIQYLNIEIAKFLSENTWEYNGKTATYNFSKIEAAINKRTKDEFVSQLKETINSGIKLTEKDQDKIASLTATGLKLGDLLNYNEASLLLEINLGKTELVDQVYSKVTNSKGKQCFALLPIIKNIQSGNIETAKQIILSAFKYFQSLPSEEGIIQYLNIEIAKFLSENTWEYNGKTATYDFSKIEAEINQRMKDESDIIQNDLSVDAGSEEVAPIGETNIEEI